MQIIFSNFKLIPVDTNKNCPALFGDSNESGNSALRDVLMFIINFSNTNNS